ncbi:MAG: 50S ribosomal protein L23 [Candidatus Bipolaricaulia bacterium]
MAGPEHLEDILIEPIISEESWRLQDENKYAFRVHPRANKPEIRKAVQEIFGVKVVGVWTMRYRGKPRRQRFYERGRTSGWKKAIVQLADGDRIEIYQ